MPMQAPSPTPPRKIIHIDMDCFYAAIEMRERPELRGLPVAVGGSSGRGVLTTCNYEARKFGCRSAMPVFKARELCPQLVVVPVRFDLYREESRRVRAIFDDFTELVEPLSLDEAYLDVSALRSAGGAIAEEVRWRISETTGLTASAGIAPNKLIAKIASDWNKPDGQFEVRPDEVAAFMHGLPVRKIWGVGRKTEDKLASLGAETCGDLQKVPAAELAARFGKFGSALFELCRGIDRREVNPDRERKSLSNERTFRQDLPHLDAGLRELGALVAELETDRRSKHAGRTVQSAFVKVKFADFQQTTAERRATEVAAEVYEELLEEAWGRGGGKEVRLLGAGVRFAPVPAAGEPVQMGLGI